MDVSLNLQAKKGGEKLWQKRKCLILSDCMRSWRLQLW